MRIVLIGTVACLTAGAFFGAERLMSSNAEVAALEQKAAVKAMVDAQLSQSNEGLLTQIAALKETEASSAAQIATLTTTVDTLTAKRDELALQLFSAQDEAAASLDRVAEIEADLLEKAGLYDEEIAEKNQELEALRAQASKLSGEDKQLNKEVASLSEELKARDAMIATLEEAIEAAKTEPAEMANADANAENAAELASAKTQIKKLTAALKWAEDTLNGRQEAITALEADIATLETELSKAKNATETAAAPSTSQAEQLSQIAALTEIVQQQESALANLRLGFGDAPAPPLEMAQVCIDRANVILGASQITFGTGTSAIAEDSIATLESLRELAIGCENDQMLLEIGGHTDSNGAQAENQALSEARATSVREFLVESGLQAENMIAVGFGETTPVATNATPTGRAANRRITFVWQVKDASEPVSDNVDG